MEHLIVDGTVVCMKKKLVPALRAARRAGTHLHVSFRQGARTCAVCAALARNAHVIPRA